jgi:hypothetical protein
MGNLFPLLPSAVFVKSTDQKLQECLQWLKTTDHSLERSRDYVCTLGDREDKITANNANSRTTAEQHRNVTGTGPTG